MKRIKKLFADFLVDIETMIKASAADAVKAKAAEDAKYAKLFNAMNELLDDAFGPGGPVKITKTGTDGAYAWNAKSGKWELTKQINGTKPLVRIGEKFVKPATQTCGHDYQVTELPSKPTSSAKQWAKSRVKEPKSSKALGARFRAHREARGMSRAAYVGALAGGYKLPVTMNQIDHLEDTGSFGTISNATKSVMLKLLSMPPKPVTVHATKPLAKPWGEAIRQRRERAGMSRQTLADHLNMIHGTKVNMNHLVYLERTGSFGGLPQSIVDEFGPQRDLGKITGNAKAAQIRRRYGNAAQ